MQRVQAKGYETHAGSATGDSIASYRSFPPVSPNWDSVRDVISERFTVSVEKTIIVVLWVSKKLRANGPNWLPEQVEDDLGQSTLLGNWSVVVRTRAPVRYDGPIKSFEELPEKKQKALKQISALLREEDIPEGDGGDGLLDSR